MEEKQLNQLLDTSISLIEMDILRLTKENLHTNIESVEDDKCFLIHLESVLNLNILISEGGESTFCIDDVMPIHIAFCPESSMLKIWGVVFWLNKPKDYIVNKSGKDPLYCEFSLTKDVRLIQMKCGDFNVVDMNKYDSYVVSDFDWIFNFFD